MDSQTQKLLLALNQRFYEQNACSFSGTRRNVQPGVRRLLTAIPPGSTLLDLGCGNGNFALALAHAGFYGSYLGIDGSAALLQEAQRALSSLSSKAVFSFLRADIASPDWAAGLQPGSFDIITCFAVLHHLPGKLLQKALFEQCTTLLKPGGQFILSAWQVFHSPSLTSRILPWSSVGVAPEQLDLGDILLDWRAGVAGSTSALRYVHVFTPGELTELGQAAGLSLNDAFYSDGKNQRLSLYQVWVKPQD